MASIEFKLVGMANLRLMLISLGLLWCVIAAHAQRTYILTVGYDETADERGGHDHYAHDARDIKRLLETKCAQPVVGAFCLEGTNATLAAFTEKLKLIRQSATNKDLVILFFSVHGETSKDGDFTIELADETLTGKALAEAFDTLRGSVLLMLDTCGAGGMLNHFVQQHQRFSAGGVQGGRVNCRRTADAVAWLLCQRDSCRLFRRGR